MLNVFWRGIEKKYISWVPGLGAHANYSFLEMYAILDYTYLPEKNILTLLAPKAMVNVVHGNLACKCCNVHVLFWPQNVDFTFLTVPAEKNLLAPKPKRYRYIPWVPGLDAECFSKRYRKEIYVVSTWIRCLMLFEEVSKRNIFRGYLD